MPLPIGLLKLYLPRLEPLELRSLEPQEAGRFVCKLDHAGQPIAFSGHLSPDGETARARLDACPSGTAIRFSAGEGPAMTLTWEGGEPLAFDLLGVVEADWDLDYNLRDT